MNCFEVSFGTVYQKSKISADEIYHSTKRKHGSAFSRRLVFHVSLKFRSYNVACTELSLASVISPFDVINCLATQKFEVNDLEI